MSLRDKLRQLPQRAVEVLGETVHVVGLTAREWVTLQDNVAQTADGKNDRLDFMARLFIACVRDAATGAPLFTDDDLAWLKTEAAGAAVRVIFNAAAELNGLGQQEDPAKNSAAAPPG